MPALSVNKLFDKLGVQKGKTLSRQEVVAGAAKLNMSAADAGALFDQLDTEKSGTLSRDAGFFKRAWSGFRSKKSSSIEGSAESTNAPFVPLYTDVGDLNETKSAEVVWVAMRAYCTRETDSRPLALFQSVDADKDGIVNNAEFAEALKLMGIVGLSDAAVENLMHFSDPKADGKLNYSELIPKLRPLKKLTVNEVFDLLDDDKSGTLTREEVVANHLRLEITEAEASSMFDELDVDRSGTLSKQEMKGIFSSLGSWAKKRAENRKNTLANLPPPVLSDKALKVKHAIEAEEAKVASLRAKAQRADGDLQATSKDGKLNMRARILGSGEKVGLMKSVNDMLEHMQESKEEDRKRFEAYCQQTGYTPPKNFAERSWRLGGGPLWFLPEKAAPWRARDDPRGNRSNPGIFE